MNPDINSESYCGQFGIGKQGRRLLLSMPKKTIETKFSCFFFFWENIYSSNKLINNLYVGNWVDCKALWGAVKFPVKYVTFKKDNKIYLLIQMIILGILSFLLFTDGASRLFSKRLCLKGKKKTYTILGWKMLFWQHCRTSFLLHWPVSLRRCQHTILLV